MKAVVFKGRYQVAVEDKPVPQIQEPHDVILKLEYTALCGSELHVYRGLQTSGTGFIMGHEFTGTVEELGKEVRTVRKGDKVVVPFTTCWCERSQLFGSENLDGGQSEYVRVPLADSSIVKAPPGIEDKYLVLMADIWPTGYFAAHNGLSSFSRAQLDEMTVVVIGCGPVGLCAVINAEEYKPRHLFAVDSVPSRLELANRLGAQPLNFKVENEQLAKRIMQVTDGRGADVVIEVVGSSSALRLGFDLLRPWGVLSSVGVHNAEIPWTGEESYDKNLRIQMGRCPVRSIFPQSLAMLQKKQHLLSFMTDHVMPLSEAAQGYQLFNDMKVQKVIFEAQK